MEASNTHRSSDVVVITGASAGAGRGTAMAFARRGARVALLARGVYRLEETKREVEDLGGQALAIPTDVADPEQVEAAAIVWATYHDRRELYVGFPAVKAIIGNKLAPAFADRYLARSGYEKQMRAEPENPNRADNLFEPVPGTAGTHGSFDGRARDGSLEFWVSKHRSWIAMGCAAIAGIAILARR